MNINPEFEEEEYDACWKDFDECMGYGNENGSGGDGSGGEFSGGDEDQGCHFDEEVEGWMNGGIV